MWQTRCVVVSLPLIIMFMKLFRPTPVISIWLRTHSYVLITWERRERDTQHWGQHEWKIHTEKKKGNSHRRAHLYREENRSTAKWLVTVTYRCNRYVYIPCLIFIFYNQNKLQRIINRIRLAITLLPSRKFITKKWETILVRNTMNPVIIFRLS
jgi:hypothetical protein